MSKFSCQLEVSLAAGAFSGNLVGSIGFSDELRVSEGELLIECKRVENIFAQFNCLFLRYCRSLVVTDSLILPQCSWLKFVRICITRSSFPTICIHICTIYYTLHKTRYRNCHCNYIDVPDIILISLKTNYFISLVANF